ncbi:cytochrome P450 [Streptomyces nojiriensis]|uniref:Cytochrome P450 n=1 Tax=Streptomyces nojiriensis TaxID=66374 RepID=A0ABQ3SJJ4_9ACTN|nr:cytochrome P450 [Streptomyces nojiriensis]QTI49925.1 Lanosterol 14-alpha demethylase [Streptomyces nojiriensis]GGS21294.1 cytochrome P450 [Streptomyces nojiriensis]GHI68318.1 cytochrome P450 [Streptomyces nojiriensis]
MRTVQGAALDGLRARVRALAARRRPERAGRSPRGEAPLADRGPAVPGLGAEAPGRRTFVKDSSRYAASAPAPAPAAETTARAALAGFGVLLRGLARPRPGDVRTSAAALRALRARQGDAPALVRTRSGRTVLVLLDPQDLRRFYDEPVSVLAAATPDKCPGPNPGEAADPADSADSGCSRGEPGAERREVSAEVLAAGRPVHPSHGPFLAALAEEARHLTGSATGAGTVLLDLARARYAVQRAARRIVLGDAAAADEQLSGWLTQLRAEGRGVRAGRVRAARSVHDRARARIAEYAARADGDTLVGRAGRHADPTGTLDPVGQAQRWLLAMDAVPDTLLRTLLLLGAHPAEQDLAVAEAAAGVAAGPDRGELPRLRACVRESLRLYPVVPDLIRVTRTETEWRGVRYPAGTSVLVPAAFHQRDPERVPAAHVFVPGRWKNPGADQDIRMAPFSHGGGRCPGDQLGLMATAALCAEVLRGHRVTGTRPVLDPVGPLPTTLDPYGIRLTLTRR